MSKEFTEKDIENTAAMIKKMTDKDLILIMDRINCTESKLDGIFNEINTKLENKIPVIMRVEDLVNINQYIIDCQNAYKDGLNYVNTHSIYNPRLKDLFIAQVENSDKKNQSYMQTWQIIMKAAIVTE